MTELVACLSTGKGTWTELIKIIRAEEWEKVFLLTNSFGKEKFNADGKTILLEIDDKKPVDLLVKDIIGLLKEKLVGPEIALNIVSGTGKEHMALLSALLKLGFGIRLVYSDNDKVCEL